VVVSDIILLKCICQCRTRDSYSAGQKEKLERFDQSDERGVSA